MRKFLKTCLIIGAVCIVVGIAASAAGINAGGLAELKEQVLNGEWSVDLGDFDLEVAPFYELEEQEFWNDDEAVLTGEELIEAAYAADSLAEIYVKGAGIAVEFLPYDGSRPELTDGGDVVVCASKSGKYQGYMQNSKLYIVVTGQSEKEIGEGLVQIMIPEALYGAGQLNVTVEASAASIDFGQIQAAEVDLEVSAGTINWAGLTAERLEIDMAAGAISGTNTSITGAIEIDMKAGSVELGGTFGTKADISVAAGKVSLNMANAFNEYIYDLSCAGGSVNVGEEKLEGLVKVKKIDNNAEKNMDIECSAGAVDIQFID